MKKTLLLILITIGVNALFAGEPGLYYDAHFNMTLTEVRGVLPDSVGYVSMEDGIAFFKVRNDYGTIVSLAYMYFTNGKLTKVRTVTTHLSNCQVKDYLMYKRAYMGKIISEEMTRSDMSENISKIEKAKVEDLTNDDNRGYIEPSSAVSFIELYRKLYNFKTVIGQDSRGRKITIDFSENEYFNFVYEKL